MADYEYALSLDSEYGYAYNNIGLIYYKRGNYDAALEQYLQSLEFDNDQPEIVNLNIGYVYQEKGNTNLH